jgi:hypothetical protein
MMTPPGDRWVNLVLAVVLLTGAYGIHRYHVYRGQGQVRVQFTQWGVPIICYGESC